MIKNRTIPILNLKEFRDVTDSTRACYQALVSGPLQLTALHGGGPLLGDYKMAVTTCDSHQVVRDLGLGTPGPDQTIVPLKFGFWLKLDFLTQEGETYWQAPV